MATFDDAASPLCEPRPAPPFAQRGVAPSWRVLATTAAPLAGQVCVDVDFVSCTS